MDAKTKNKFKKMLLEERQRVLNAATKTLDEIKIDPDDLPDEVDQAVSELNQNLLLSLRDREREQLISINNALDRIANGTYGECTSCSDPIEIKRLEARPMCRLCFSCQEESERKRKVFA